MGLPPKPCGNGISPNTCQGGPTQDGCQDECNGIITAPISLRSSARQDALPADPQPFSLELFDSSSPASLLRQLQRQISSISSLYLKSTFLARKRVQILSPDTAQQPSASEKIITGTGTVEYWEDNGRFKAVMRSDDSLGLLSNRILSFDGSTFYHLFEKAGLLSMSAHKPIDLHYVLPVPLLWPLDFVTVGDEGCRLCFLRLEHLQEAASWRQLHYESIATKSEAEKVLQVSREDADRTSLRHTIALGVGTSGPVIRSVKRWTKEALAISFSMSSFEPFKGPGLVMDFPRTIEVDIRQSDLSDEEWEFTFVVNALELNQPMGDAAFIVEDDDATFVWDNDGRLWLKHPHPDAAALIWRVGN